MSEAWRDANYQYRKEITVQDANIDGDLTDFPLLVAWNNDTDLETSKVQSDLDDVRFYDSSGNLLKFEIDDFEIDGTDSTARIWVKKPTLYASPSGSDNKIWMYYGYASAANGEDAANVWDSNFKGVWHCQEDPSGSAPQILDSTSNNNDGTSNGSMTSGDSVSGIVGNGLDFDGSNDYIDVGDAIESTDNSGKLTLEVWLNGNSLAAWDAIVGKDQGVGGNDSDWGLWLQGSKKPDIWGTFGSYKNLLTGTTVLANGTDYYIAFASGASDHELYVNGASEATETSSGAWANVTNNPNMTIGRVRSNTYNINGVISEVRVSAERRSDAWIKFCHHNIAAADNELTWGSEEAQGSGGSILPILLQYCG